MTAAKSNVAKSSSPRCSLSLSPTRASFGRRRVTDEIIELGGPGALMPKVFLSHTHQDADAVRQIAVALTEGGLETWLDAEQLFAGDELLAKIASAIDEVDHFVLLLSRAALAKPWVLTEMRIALTLEIERRRPQVIVLRLDDCPLPIEASHKVYLDLKPDFGAALGRLVYALKRAKELIPVPKQTILSEMIERANPELWARLGAGGADQEWKQTEAADAVRQLNANELEAAVKIGSKWSEYKAWEGDLVATIVHATGVGEQRARMILKGLAERGFLQEADDLDYRMQPERAWTDGSLLWVLTRAARRSGLFAGLPPPLPERLSSLLEYRGEVFVVGDGWYALRFREPCQTIIRDGEFAIAAVARLSDPQRTWIFPSRGGACPGPGASVRRADRIDPHEAVRRPPGTVQLERWARGIR